MCRDGAAKSVVATAIARDIAQREGYAIGCSNAGTDPDAHNNPLAVAALAAKGLENSEEPRLVDAPDISGADVAISWAPQPT